VIGEVLLQLVFIYSSIFVDKLFLGNFWQLKAIPNRYLTMRLLTHVNNVNPKIF